MSTYLVTGANRGIGKAFIAAYLQRPNSTVIAAVRTPSSAKSLNDFPKADGSKLIIVKIDSFSETDPKDAVAELQKQGVDHIDFVIANAGIAGEKSTATIDIIPSVARDVFNVNSIAPLLLLNATSPLLKKSNKPTFAVVSSAAGSIGIQAMFAEFPVKMSPYGASKAAVNWLVERIHLEEKWLVAISLHPGLVTTDMSAGALPDGMDPKEFGITPLTPDESVKQMNEVLDRATREKEGGKLVQHDGEILPW
ncbi:aflatoxin biosynthesis ketoreductase nor-1 [Elsinoe ampelina]|uniref:Aflatoxin biosynthesis ketoreductase nor-1 n=1 Tax=Elsinoe ampelina TaxID=302913 RepID=A0A6A6GN89_9PEZI|nr:aflatoxin biosynthesis ketoreductase nor-1 [Elsinoe ampelina]